MKLPEFWRTYAAVLVLAGLGAYIYFVESKKEPAGDEKPKEKVFAALDKAKVKEVAIDNAGGEKVRLVKDGEGWKMAAPFAGPADASAVDSLVGTLETLRMDEVAVENATSFAEYGLDKPRIAVSVTVDGAPAPLRLELGGSSRTRAGSTPRSPTSPASSRSPPSSSPRSTRRRSTCATATSST